MTDSEIIELLQMQLKTQQQQNKFLQRTIRNLKSKSKVAGNFLSDDGARWYLKIRSYIDSARKHGIKAFEAVKLAFAGNPELCLGF